MKEPTDIDTLATSRNGDRKNHTITIKSRPSPTKKKKSHIRLFFSKEKQFCAFHKESRFQKKQLV